MMNSLNSVLIIAAHPDDEVLGCGGTIAKFVSNGTKVDVLIVATGATGRLKSTELDQSELDILLELKEDSKKANEILGVNKVTFLDYPDNRLDTVSKMDLALDIKNHIQKIKPDAVFTHHFGDYNWDHQIVFDTTLMAARANTGDFIPNYVLSYEVLSSTERSFQSPQHIFTPNIYIDIEKQLNKKIEALKCYKTELNAYPHPRSPEVVKTLADKRGVEVSLKQAECFQLIRGIVN
jgi:LmbE family N-acetylglucosaminyl deacetylase